MLIDSMDGKKEDEDMKQSGLRINLYLLVISGFLLVIAGMTIRQGGVVHVVLGGAVAGGAIGVFVGRAIHFFKHVRRRSH
jgi:hypothetical protein